MVDPLGPLMTEVTALSVSGDVHVTAAVEVLRLALGRKVTAPAGISQAPPLAPPKQPWPDADARAADAESDSDLNDDSFAHASKRSRPADELNASGTRPSLEPADSPEWTRRALAAGAGWRGAPAAAVQRARSRLASLMRAGAGRHLRAWGAWSRASLRGEHASDDGLWKPLPTALFHHEARGPLPPSRPRGRPDRPCMLGAGLPQTWDPAG